jgi:CubicO group peptidase (beta-lactamase class C family)
VVVVYNGEIKYLKCFGVKVVKTNEPVTYNTLFEIGSSTKAFKSTNLAQLVDAGLISWNDKVTRFYPNSHEFRMHTSDLTNEVRIRDLLSHQTGLPDHGADAL